jgi:YD repeat-containing protein
MTVRQGPHYTYDNNGNLLSKTNGSSTTSYAWDFENRLTSVTLPNNGGAISFTYDPFGRRIRKVSPTGTTICVYDRDNSIEEVNGSGNVVERHTYGPGDLDLPPSSAHRNIRPKISERSPFPASSQSRRLAIRAAKFDPKPTLLLEKWAQYPPQ